jgi:hypothetical protein
MIHMLVIVPVLLIGLAASFSPHRHRIYPPLALGAAIVLGLGVAAIQIIARSAASRLLFPVLDAHHHFHLFHGRPDFLSRARRQRDRDVGLRRRGHRAAVPGREFSYDALAMLAANLFCASVVYMHEKTSRLRFLEACMLREMVARDGLTGIQNRRMFDQHIQRSGSRRCATQAGGGAAGGHRLLQGLQRSLRASGGR